jgi:hypothetical protein
VTSVATHLTASQKADALRRAASGESLTAIATSFGVTRQAVRGLLRRRGVPARVVGRLTETERLEVVQRYVDGSTVPQLALAFGITDPAVRSLLIRRGVYRRATHTLRHDAFEIFSEEAMYWIGFLFADGCVAYRVGHIPQISVGLAERDRDHLVALREFLGSNGKISEPQATHRACQFSFRSAQLAARLIELGRYDGPINRELAASSDFWRGVVDGDGSIGSYGRPGSLRAQPQIRLVGQRRLLEAFREFLAIHGIKGLSVRPHKSIFNIGTTGRPARRIIELLYRDASVALARKADRAAQVLAA